MGTADLVPGVSGGTIALVLGIYERLVASIRRASSAIGNLVRGDLAGARSHSGKIEWVFLVPLLVGILAAVATLASFLEHQLEVRPTVLAGVFLGLVLGSVAIAWRLIKHTNTMHVVIVALVGLALFVVLGLGEGSAIGDPSPLALVGAGGLAICAMILPGISGSLILLMLGMYSAVLGAVTDRDFGSLGLFAVGAVVGLALFSQILNWGLNNHHDLMVATLVGLMAGSTRVLWPWPNGVDSVALERPGEDWPAVLGSALLGVVAVFLISRLAPAPVTESAPSAGLQSPDGG